MEVDGGEACLDRSLLNYPPQIDVVHNTPLYVLWERRWYLLDYVCNPGFWELDIVNFQCTGDLGPGLCFY